MDNRIINCDIFCTEDFSFDGQIVITGNFYASSARICVKGIDAGGDIIFDSSSPFDAVPFIYAAFLYSCGKISLNNYGFLVDAVYSEEGTSFNFDGQVELKSYDSLDNDYYNCEESDDYDTYDDYDPDEDDDYDDYDSDEDDDYDEDDYDYDDYNYADQDDF